MDAKLLVHNRCAAAALASAPPPRPAPQAHFDAASVVLAANARRTVPSNPGPLCGRPLGVRRRPLLLEESAAARP